MDCDVGGVRARWLLPKGRPTFVIFATRCAVFCSSVYFVAFMGFIVLALRVASGCWR
jgi:hypothetical protein